MFEVCSEPDAVMVSGSSFLTSYLTADTPD